VGNEAPLLLILVLGGTSKVETIHHRLTN